VGHHAPGTILESNELGAVLDLDAERGQPIALPPPLAERQLDRRDSINSRWRLPGSLTGLGGSAIVERGRVVEELGCADSAPGGGNTVFIHGRRAHGQPQNVPVAGRG